MVHPVLKEAAGSLGLLVLLVKKARLVKWDVLVVKERMDQRGYQGHQDPQARKECPVLRE